MRCHNLPDADVADLTILMGEDVTLCDDRLPGNFWMCLLEWIGNTTGCFSENLQLTLNR